MLPAPTMVLERYRSGWEATLAPLARGAHRIGITPNTITLVSFGFALLAAGTYYLADTQRPWLLLLGAAFVGINAIFDGLDGKLARLTNQSSRRGDYLDHVLDRYSDLAILIGLTLSPLGHTVWGLFAIAGTFLTSYMGTQAQALGLGRNYRGLLGRADRLLFLIAVPAIATLMAYAGVRLPWGLTPIVVMLAYFAIAGNLTALERIRHAWAELGTDGQ